jgi:hypothetical protein
LAARPRGRLISGRHVKLKSRNTKNSWEQKRHVQLESRNTKKRGRPASGQDPILSFRLPLHFKQTIDRWRSTERDKPSRSEAIRWLIGQGLTAEFKKRTE